MAHQQQQPPTVSSKDSLTAQVEECYRDAVRYQQQGPKTDAEWASICFARWEDAIEIKTSDPFWTRNDSSWEHFYKYMDDAQQRLLTPKRNFVSVQRHVRDGSEKFGGGSPAPPPPTPVAAAAAAASSIVISGDVPLQPPPPPPQRRNVQDFESVFPIGCTRMVAVIAATVDDDPAIGQRNELFIMPITMAESPRVELFRPESMPPQTQTKDYSFHTNLAHQFETNSIDAVWPVWRRVKPLSRENCDPHLPGSPCASALDPESGHVAVLCTEQLSKLALFNVHAQTRRPDLELPRSDPCNFAIGERYLAVGYIRPDMPPHIYLYDLLANKWARTMFVPELAGKQKTTNLRASSAEPDPSVDDAAAAAEDVSIVRFTCLEFHRTHSHLLLLGSMDGGMMVLDIEHFFREQHNATQFNGHLVHAGPDVLQLYRSFRKQVEPHCSEADTAEALRRLPNPPRAPVWFIRWHQYADNNNDTRLLMGQDSAMVIVNAAQHTADAKLRLLGKKATDIMPRDTPLISMEARGDLLVLHDAATQHIIIAHLGSLTPRWTFKHPDVVDQMGDYARPYPSLAVFSRRIVVLWPNGFVGFIEAASDEMIKKYEQEEERMLVERLKNSVKLTDDEPTQKKE